jgi:hypothetical protein
LSVFESVRDMPILIIFNVGRGRGGGRGGASDRGGRGGHSDRGGRGGHSDRGGKDDINIVISSADILFLCFYIGRGRGGGDGSRGRGGGKANH